MLVLKFSAQDVARTRLAISPLWEVVTSVQTLKEPRRHAPHLRWVERSQQQLRQQRVSMELLSALVPVPSYYIPDFLTPVPATAAPTIEDELAVLVATTPEEVRADLHRMNRPLAPELGAMYSDPVGGLNQLANEIRSYWERVLAAYWPRMQRLLDGEILYRARTMVQDGAAGLFADLHPQISWQDDTLTVAHPWYEATRQLTNGRGLVLVPSVFAWPGVFSQTNPPGQPGLVYPARGVGAVWQVGLGPVPKGLARVLGNSRALLLSELGMPASTTELASHLKMSAANVSHHLTTLREAGLVRAFRTGHSVLYVRTAVADELLTTSLEE
ncbi:helix-turn-helix domain-containing protein [Micromonospora sp. NPDC005979]|uniref:ArsR/SmtB family transcription factor n=1 Tax=Micromonospora sp. NPDC005979 TaxID=3156726 RepID=UPI0033A556B4